LGIFFQSFSQLSGIIALGFGVDFFVLNHFCGAITILFGCALSQAPHQLNECAVGNDIVVAGRHKHQVFIIFFGGISHARDRIWQRFKMFSGPVVIVRKYKKAGRGFAARDVCYGFLVILHGTRAKRVIGAGVGNIIGAAHMDRNCPSEYLCNL